MSCAEMMIDTLHQAELLRQEIGDNGGDPAMTPDPDEYEYFTGGWKDIGVIGRCSECRKSSDLGVDSDWEIDPRSIVAVSKVALCRECYERKAEAQGW